MKHGEHAVQLGGWVEAVALPVVRPLGMLARFVAKTLVIAEIDVRKLRRDPTELVTRTIQPVLWLLVFGQVFTRARVMPTGDLSYLDFMTPGILAQSVMFTAIFQGISVIWERDMGIIHRFLASPTPRAALVLGKALSAGVRSLVQGMIICLLAFIVGVQLAWHVLALGGVLVFIFLGATIFSTFSMVIACLVKTRERFMGIGQALTMPLFFASNAIYPISMMPTWLQVVAHINPLTYEVDGLRSLMLVGSGSIYGVGVDLLILLVTAGLLLVVASKLYPTVVV